VEYPRVLEHLASHTAFSAGRELALALEPSFDLHEVSRRQAETAEARWLLSAHPATRIGGVRDVRPLVENAHRAALLMPSDLLDVHQTLESADRLRHVILRVKTTCPHLADIAEPMESCTALVDEIARCLDDRGNVKDGASTRLAEIRSALPRARERLRTRLEHLIRTPQNIPYLQEPLITQRGGRYVVPLKAEHKGRIPGVVHDQSASGATLFIEPLAIVELNNAYRQLELAEQQEIERILRSLTALVAENGDEIVWTVEALAALDLAFAKAEYAEALHAIQPTFVDHASFDLRDARHPLLAPETVVPISVRAGDDFTILVITGPNTGGKTVTLKTVGLLALMAQAGLHIPAAEGSRLALFSGIYADIGDEQSIEQSLSTFSGHLRNIVRILEKADNRSLVLLDELGAGTDPIEGAALARALLAHLLRRRIVALVATHYSELKAFAQVTPSVANASLEFDLETLSPTYRLTIGLPGRSSALAIAERLGLDHAIISEAREAIDPEAVEVDEMVSAIQHTQAKTAETWEEARRAEETAKALEQEWHTRMAAIEEERVSILNAARQEARAELEAVQKRLRALAQRAEAMGQPLVELQQVCQETESLAEEVQPLPVPASHPPVLSEPVAGPLEVGDTVWVASLEQKAVVVAIQEGEVEVKAGSFRLRVSPEEVALRAKGETRAQKSAGGEGAVFHPSPGQELDLRGCTVDEALPLLDKYLDDAYLAGLPGVRIIHGKGTGALRKATREWLASHPLVAGLRPGGRYEGGNGVTVAELG